MPFGFTRFTQEQKTDRIIALQTSTQNRSVDAFTQTKRL